MPKCTNDAFKKFDIYIGNKLKLIRYQYRLSQRSIAQMMGVSTQQFQKYETGKNSLSVAKLCLIIKKFNFDIDSFLKEISFESFRDGNELPIYKDLFQEKIMKTLVHIKGKERINIIKNLINEFIKFEELIIKNEKDLLEKGD
jgi:transcriptional regulator with XRE-family HTH domain